MGKLIGTLAPIGVGVALLAAGGTNQIEGEFYGYLVAGGLTLGAGTPTGFFVGRAVDRRFDQFVIIPESRTSRQ